MLAAVLAGSHEAVSCWERWPTGDVRLVTANERFMAIVDRPGQAVPAGALLGDVVPRLPPGAAALLTHVLDTGEPFSIDGHAVGMPDGSIRHWNVTLTPLIDTLRPTAVVSIADATPPARDDVRSPAREAGEGAELEVSALRRELMDELLLHRHLVEIGGRLGGAQASAAPAEVFPLLAERLNEVLPIKSLTVNRVDEDTQTYRAIYHSDPGAVAEAMMRFEAPIGAGVTGRAALERRWIISNSGTDAPGVDVPGTPDEDEHLMAVPVLIDERVRAVLTLRRTWRALPFDAADARRAELFAQHVTAALLLVELAETGEELAASRKVLAEQVQKLESLNGLKDEFIANVSHELRTPLTAVLGNLATLNMDIDLTDEVRAELLVRAERQARRLGDLLENLLAASRLAGEEPAMITEQIDVRGLLQEVAATLRARAPGRTVTLRIKGSPAVSTDPTLLYRVLYNLGDNALKYSDGTVSLAARSTGDAVRIDVRDRGIGIAPEDLPKVFGRFQQLDQTGARRVGGVGLGLYLSSRLATALGGRIDVVSTPGEGSTFTLVLPVQPQMNLLDAAAGEREADELSA